MGGRRRSGCINLHVDGRMVHPWIASPGIFTDRSNDNGRNVFFKPSIVQISCSGQSVLESFGENRDEIAKLNYVPASKRLSRWLGFNRGDIMNVFLAPVARQHSIPVISMPDAMFPSFTRFFVAVIPGQGAAL